MGVVMGEYAEYAMMSHYRANGACVPVYPKGYNSEKRQCPICGNGIMGREAGMMDHLKMKHHIKSRDERLEIEGSLPRPQP